MGTIVLSAASTTFTPVSLPLSLSGELSSQASGGPCAASCSRTASGSPELAPAVTAMESAQHYDDSAPLASPTGESSQSGSSTPSASRMLQVSRDPMDQAVGAPQAVYMSRGLSAESPSMPFVTPPLGEAVDLDALTPPVPPASPPAHRRPSTASSVASSGRRSLCDGVAALASHILSVQTSPERLALAATAPALARRRSREADSASSSSGRSRHSSAAERPERRGSRSLSFSESEETFSALGLANMDAASPDGQQTRRRANSEVAQPSVAVSSSSSNSTQPTTPDRSDAPEIGRTLSTSTSTTDRSSNVSSLDTCATSTGSLSDAMPPSKDLRIDTVHVPAPSVPQQQHSPDGQGERPHTTPQTTPELLFPPAGSRRASDGQRFSKLRRLYAMHELVETERRFAEDLSLLMVFFDNLNDQPYFSEHPERIATVTRNARQMLLLHSKVADKLEAILRDAGLDPADGVAPEAASSEAAEAAVVSVAQYFTQMGPSLASEFSFFCSRHAEALAVVREAERRHGGDDWKAFERSCSNILRGMSRGGPRSLHSRTPSGSATPVSGSHFLTGLTPLTQLSSGFDAASLAPLSLYGNSAPTTPMSESASSSMLREGAARLLFSDYFVKPIQRLCLYPVCLNTLLKHSPEDEEAHAPLLAALSTMRKVAEDVDRAGREREKDLMAELISSRIEPQMSVTPAFIGSLGHCLLAGALDVCHHHSIVNPLSAPLRFKYQAVFLYRGFLTIAKVRKPHTYEPKHWFPLWAARLDDAQLSRGERSATASSSVLPLSFRIICQGGHYFELVAASAREREIWIDHLSRAIVDAPLTANASTGFPSSLGSASRLAADLGDSGAPTPDEDDPHLLDPLSAFFAENAASPTPVDITVRYAPASQRATVDRATVFSDVIYQARSGSAFGQRTDADGSLPSWHSATPAIGAAVGAAMGFARAAARKTVSRRSSAILSDEDNAADGPLGAAGAALAAAELRLNSNGADGATWKQKMRNSRSRPGLFVSPALRASADQLVSQGTSPSSIFGDATLHDEPLQSLAPLTPALHASESSSQRAATMRPTHARSKASVLSVWPTRGRSKSAEADLAVVAALAKESDFGPILDSSAASEAPRTEAGELIFDDATFQAVASGATAAKPLSRPGSLRRAFGSRRKRTDSTASNASSSGATSPYPLVDSVAGSRESLASISPLTGLAALVQRPSFGSLRRSWTMNSGRSPALSSTTHTSSPSALLSDGELSSPTSPECTSPVLREDRTRRRSAPGEVVPASAYQTNSSKNAKLKASRRLSLRFLHGSRAAGSAAPLVSVAETTQEYVQSAVQHDSAPGSSSPARPELPRRPSTADGIRRT